MLYAYAVFLGAAYLLAFWRPFGLTPFPFLSLTDFITTPLDRVIVLVAVPLLPLPAILTRLHLRGAAVRNFGLTLVVLHALFALTYTAEAIYAHWTMPFSYRKEFTILFAASLLTSIGLMIVWEAVRVQSRLSRLVVALGVFQCAAVLAAGYKDGKAIYNGALEVHFLETKELCEKNSERSWVLVGRFTEVAVFMDTLDKRLCVTAEKSYRLRPRAVFEPIAR